jgi:flagella basal body P-ring formation protein FlgA
MTGVRPFSFNTKAIIHFMVGIMALQQVWVTGLFAGADPVPNADIQITIKETSRVVPSQIFLGDIADIQANGLLKEALEKVVLGSSPKPDQIKSFDRKKICAVVRGQRYLPKNITILSPQRVYVKRVGQVISKQDVRHVMDQYLTRAFNNRDCQLTSFIVRGLEVYPQGKTTLLLDPGGSISKNGRLSFFLDVIIDGKKEDRVSVSGAVAVYETVLHTSRAYAKGETISRETVYPEKKNIFELADKGIKTFEEIDQKVLKSNIRKGDVIKQNLLMDPPLIQKGDMVKLIAANETLSIVTSGISREDGFKDQVITVENISSGKFVRGIVKGKSKVEVMY